MFHLKSNNIIYIDKNLFLKYEPRFFQSFTLYFNKDKQFEIKKIQSIKLLVKYYLNEKVLDKVDEKTIEILEESVNLDDPKLVNCFRDCNIDRQKVQETLNILNTWSDIEKKKIQNLFKIVNKYTRKVPFLEEERLKMAEILQNTFVQNRINSYIKELVEKGKI